MIDGKYRVLETIDDSDLRAVHLAEHVRIGRRVILKVLHGKAASDPIRLGRFVSEAEAAGQLRHPNVVESIDMGIPAGGEPYVAFEYLQGARLGEEIRRLGKLPPRRAVHIARQIAAALSAAHAAGLVHGCLETSSVFLVDANDDPDFVKVLGVGKMGDGRRARASTTSTMAPEQIIDHDRVDQRCDVWALGAVLYEMLTGRPAFQTDGGPSALRREIVRAEVAPIAGRVPKELADLVMRCLERDPRGRYQDMSELDAELSVFDLRATITDPSITIPPFLGEPTEPGVRDRRPSTPIAAMAIGARPSTQQIVTRVTTETSAPRFSGQLMVAGPEKRSFALAAGLTLALVAGGAGALFGLTRDDDAATAGAPATPVAAAGGAIAPTAAAAVAPATHTIERPASVTLSVQTSAPRARVVFRRRVVPAPTSFEVSTSDVVELVEVSAPGHKTTRYWLTIDRPTELRAQLVPGDGLVEASEIDTMIALGEADDSAALAATRPAPQDEVKRSTKSERRKIGRKSDEKATTEIAAAPAAADADSAPAGEAPAGADALAPTKTWPEPASTTLAASKAAPAPATKAAPAAATKTAPTVASKAAPPTKPAAPATAFKQVQPGFLASKRTAGNPDIQPDNGTRQAMRHEGVKKATGRFQLCVDATGKVASVKKLVSSGYAGYDARIEKEMRTWKFSPIAIAGAATGVCSAVSVAYAQQ